MTAELPIFNSILFVEAVFEREQVFGGCDAWHLLTKSLISERSVTMFPVELTFKYMLWPEKVISASSCTQISEIELILNAFRGGIRGSYPCDNTTWRMDKCFDDTLSVCVDCDDPCEPFINNDCSILSTSPCIDFAVSDGCPMPQSFGRTLAVTYEPRVPPPIIQGLHITRFSSSSLTVFINVTSPSEVSCVAIPSSGRLYSVDQVYFLGITATATPNSTSTNATIASNSTYSTFSGATIELKGLEALSTYFVYCGTQSRDGSYMSLNEVLRSKTVGSTACCKSIVFSCCGGVAQKQDGSVAFEFGTLSVTAPPSVSLSVAIDVSDGGNSYLYPSRIIEFDNDASGTSLMSSLSLSDNAPHRSYIVNATLFGPSATEFVLYYEGSMILSVLAPTSQPPVPAVVSTAFSNDGSYIHIVFDSATDLGNKPWGEFACSDLIVLSALEPLNCRWVNTFNLSIDLSGFELFEVGDSLNIAENKIRAKCTTQSCTSWTTVPSLPLIITAPLKVELPVVSVMAPKYLSKCVDFTMSIGASTNSLGRPWKAVNVTAVKLDSSHDLDLENLLNSPRLHPIPDVMTAPRSFFTDETMYIFHVTLCNFLGGCAHKQFSTVTLSSVAPTVYIDGSVDRIVRRRDSLILKTSSYKPSCDTVGDTAITRSTSALTYSWTVSDSSGVVVIPNIQSESNSKSSFKLSPFKLSVFEFYVFTVTAFDKASLSQSSSSVRIYVQQANVVAVLRESVISIPFNSTYVVDASQSYDEDVEGISQFLSFSWTCTQRLPTLASTCPIDLFQVVDDNRFLNITSRNASRGTTALLTVHVEDIRSFNESLRSKRSSSTSMLIEVTDVGTPIVNIQSNSISKVNPNKKLKLQGSVLTSESCLQSWKMQQRGFDSNPDYNLESVTSTALSKTLSIPTSNISSGNDRKYFASSLVLRAGTLTGGGTFDFYLSCTGLMSQNLGTAVLTVEINQTPRPGQFTVTPRQGEELTTSFLLGASYWVDADLPLLYEFSYFQTSKSKPSVLQTKSESSRKQTLLTKTGQTDNVKVYVKVFDFFDAYVTASDTIQVFSISNVVMTLETLFTTTDDPLDTSDIAIISGALNVNDCLRSPNCNSLKREVCHSVPNTCGPCFEGYMSEATYSNSKCASVAEIQGNSALRHTAVGGSFVLASSECSASIICPVWRHCEVIDNIATCVADTKSCPKDEFDRECSGPDAGVCKFHSTVGSMTGFVDKCEVGDSACAARCVCRSGFAGLACTFDQVSFLQRQSLRNDSVFAMKAMLLEQDISTDQIVENIAQISSLTLQPTELLNETVITVILIIEDIMHAAGEISVEIDDLVSLFEPLCAASSLALSSNLMSIDYVISLMDYFGTLVSTDLVIGEESFELIQPFARSAFSTQNLDDERVNITLETARSAFEIAIGGSGSKLSLVGSGRSPGFVSWVISMTTMSVTVASGGSTPSYSTLNTPIIRNGLTVDSVSSSFESDQEIFILLRNKESIGYDNTTSAQSQWEYSVHYYCDLNSRISQNITCPVSGYQMLINCTGESGLFSVACPDSMRLVSPSCYLNDNECRVVSYDSIQTTCACNFSLIEAKRRMSTSQTKDVRRVLNVADTKVTQVFQYTAVTKDRIAFDSETAAVDYTLGAIDPVVNFDTIFYPGLVFVYAFVSMILIGLFLIIGGYWIDYTNDEGGLIPPKLSTASGDKVIPSTKDTPPLPSAIVAAASAATASADSIYSNKSVPMSIADGVGDDDRARLVVEAPLPHIFQSFRPTSYWKYICEELSAYYKWRLPYTTCVGLLHPHVGASHDMFKDNTFLVFDCLSLLLSSVLIYLYLEPATISDSSSSCQEQFPGKMCTSSVGAATFGDRCEWNVESERCGYQPLPELGFTIVLAACSAIILSTPLCTVSRYILRTYVLVPTLKQDDVTYNPWEMFLPDTVIQWIVHARQSCDEDSWLSWLYDVPVGAIVDEVYDLALEDLELLGQKIFEFRRRLPSAPKVHRFSISWDLSMHFDTFINDNIDHDCDTDSNIDEHDDVDDRYRFESNIFMKSYVYCSMRLKRVVKDALVFFQSWGAKRLTIEDYLHKDLIRVHEHMAAEHAHILWKVQYSNEPLDERRVLRLLYEDLLSDNEVVIFHDKCRRDAMSTGSYPPNPKCLLVKFFTTMIMVTYSVSVLTTIFYFAVSRIHAIQIMCLTSIFVSFIIEIFLVHPVSIIVSEVLIPWLLRDKMIRIKKMLVRCIVQLDDLKINPGKFRWSLLLFASARVSARYYTSRIGELVSVLCLNIPRRSSKIQCYPELAIDELCVSSRKLYFSEKTISALQVHRIKHWIIRVVLAGVSKIVANSICYEIMIQILVCSCICPMVLFPLKMYYMDLMTQLYISAGVILGATVVVPAIILLVNSKKTRRKLASVTPLLQRHRDSPRKRKKRKKGVKSTLKRNDMGEPTVIPFTSPVSKPNVRTANLVRRATAISGGKVSSRKSLVPSSSSSLGGTSAGTSNQSSTSSSSSLVSSPGLNDTQVISVVSPYDDDDDDAIIEQEVGNIIREFEHGSLGNVSFGGVLEGISEEEEEDEEEDEECMGDEGNHDDEDEDYDDSKDDEDDGEYDIIEEEWCKDKVNDSSQTEVGRSSVAGKSSEDVTLDATDLGGQLSSQNHDNSPHIRDTAVDCNVEKEATNSQEREEWGNKVTSDKKKSVTFNDTFEIDELQLNVGSGRPAGDSLDSSSLHSFGSVDSSGYTRRHVRKLSPINTDRNGGKLRMRRGSDIEHDDSDDDRIDAYDVYEEEAWQKEKLKSNDPFLSSDEEDMFSYHSQRSGDNQLGDDNDIYSEGSYNLDMYRSHMSSLSFNASIDLDKSASEIMLDDIISKRSIASAEGSQPEIDPIITIRNKFEEEESRMTEKQINALIGLSEFLETDFSSPRKKSKSPNSSVHSMVSGRVTHTSPTAGNRTVLNPPPVLNLTNKYRKIKTNSPDGC